jgi:hypothetical protein
MEYELLPRFAYNKDLEPRFLTDMEMESIIGEFPPINAADGKAAEFARDEIIRNLRYQLALYKLVPVPEVRRILSEIIIRAHDLARIHKGDAINTVCADALAASVTQMVLDTFKQAGKIQTVNAGVQGMRNVLYAINKQDSACTIHFNVAVNVRDVFDMKSMLVYTTIMSVVSSYDIAFREGVVDIPPGDVPLKLDWWHTAYFDLKGYLTREYRNVLRLRLDTKKMYEHRITMKMIIYALTKENPNLYICIQSPFKDGIIDIFPNEDQVRFRLKAHGDVPNASVVFLNRLIRGGDKKISGLADLRVKGIPGISGIIGIEQNVTSLLMESKRMTHKDRSDLAGIEPNLYVSSSNHRMAESRVRHIAVRDNVRATQEMQRQKDEAERTRIRTRDNRLETKREIAAREALVEKVKEQLAKDAESDAKYEEDRLVRENTQLTMDVFLSKVWRNQINLRTARKYGLRIENLLTLISLSGAVVIYTRKNKLDQITSIYTYVPGKKNLSLHLDEYIDANKDDDWIQSLVIYVYARTAGGNLKELLKIPWIDKKRTTSSNILEINSIFGCESSRSFAVYEIVQIMEESGISINSRHITVVTDFMFNRGLPLGMTYYGIAKQKGVFGILTVERPMQVIVGAAPYGKEESALNSSVTTFYGMAPPVGSGYHRALATEEDIAEYRKRLEESRRLRERQSSILNNDAAGKTLASISMGQYPLPNDDEEWDMLSVSTDVTTPMSRPAPIILTSTRADYENAPGEYVPKAMSPVLKSTIIEAIDTTSIIAVKDVFDDDAVMTDVPDDSGVPWFSFPIYEGDVIQSFTSGVPSSLIPRAVVLPSLSHISSSPLVIGGLNYDIAGTMGALSMLQVK